MTLCIDCHNRKPRKALHDLCGGDPKLVLLYFFKYFEDDRRIVDGLTEAAKAVRMTFPEYVEMVLSKHLESLPSSHRKPKS